MKTIKRMFGLAALSLVIPSVSGAASVDRVVARQQWPWSAGIVVDYEITANTPQDVTVTAYDGEAALGVVADAAITGQRFCLTSGSYRLTIDPTKAGLGSGVVKDFKVELTLGDASAANQLALYKIVDLKSGAVTDVSKGSLLNGDWGSVERNTIPATTGGAVIDSVIWTEVTNHVVHPEYKDTKMVFRYVPAGKFKMLSNRQDKESAGADITLTKDYYIAVFEVTHQQFGWCYNWNYGTFSGGQGFRPQETITLSMIRGTAVWPTDQTTVDSSSFIGVLRARSGLPVDLPTEAQWERAARAGTNTPYPDGNSFTAAGCTDESNAYLDVIGRYQKNGGFVNGASPSDKGDPSKGTAIVGSYRPNAWGLYDVCGNVEEICLDQWIGTSSWWAAPNAVDPVGVKPGQGWDTSATVARGGCYASLANQAFVSQREAYKRANWDAKFGFRPVFTVDNQ